ncbi:MAG: endolytic transglycosylase MltG [Clostridia bacterium]|nr:endolytic transglycosylase MltG [Clostridia bacterium]
MKEFFQKIWNSFREFFGMISEVISGTIHKFKEKNDMKKQKKKNSPMKKPLPGKKKTSNVKTTREKQSRGRTVRTVKLRKSNAQIIAGRIFWLSFLVILVILGVFTYKLTNNFVKDRDATDIKSLVGVLDETNSSKLYIPLGSDTGDIAEILIENEIISDDRILGFTLFELYSMLMGNDGGYKSGNHWINDSIDYNNPVGYDMLIYIFSQNPIQNPTARIFFAEGLTYRQTVNRFLENEFLDEERFAEVANNYDFGYEFLDQIPNNNRYNRLEGYLFPDTYIFDKTKPEEEAIDKMLANFETKFKELYKKRLEELGMTMDEIIIIASLVEKEAMIDTERDTIAGVIYNRLESSEGFLNYLQIDATIQYYYLNETGKVKEPLLTEDTLIDSPYNTYKYPGLPPGPICNPGEKSIIAALFPEEHNYYYYVAKGDGSHAFASTLQQHNNNVIKYSGN